MEQNYSDKTLTCRCGNQFVLTAGEQKWFTEKMQQNPDFSMPKRCQKCRQEKRKMNEQREQR